MSIPNLPAFYNMRYTDKDGNMTGESQFYNDQMFQTLNAIVNQFNNGVQFPNKTTAEITALEPDSPNGTTWFNTSIAKLQVKTAAGTIETITSS